MDFLWPQKQVGEKDPEYRQVSICISIGASGLTPEVELLFACVISTDANTLRIEGKEESTYRQCTGCKMVTEALNVVKRQRFDFLSSVLTATPGDRLTVKQLLRGRPEVLTDATIQTPNDQNRNK